jgi:hypothetical protein
MNREILCRKLYFQIQNKNKYNANNQRICLCQYCELEREEE